MLLAAIKELYHVSIYLHVCECTYIPVRDHFVHDYLPAINYTFNTTLKQSKIEAIAYPNPAEELLNIEYRAAKREQVQLRIVDLKGQILKELNWFVQQGPNIRSIYVEQLVKGVYTLQLTQGTTTTNLLFVKK